jgi:protein-tyrosine phosphatase
MTEPTTSGLVDIHSHVLPEVDDGAASMQMALDMLRRAESEGVSALVVTPHVRSHDEIDRNDLHARRFDELQAAVATSGIQVELFLGAELAFRFGLAEVARWSTVPLADGPYVLVDLPMGPMPTGLEQGFFELRAAGFKPILAHPERHRELATAPDQVERLRHQELLFQVDAGSFTGRFGRRAKATAETFLQMGYIEFVGSDGHDLEKRPISLQSARRLVTQACGPLEAHRLFCANPASVVKGEPVLPRSDAGPTAATEEPSRWQRISRAFTGGARAQ